MDLACKYGVKRLALTSDGIELEWEHAAPAPEPVAAAEPAEPPLRDAQEDETAKRDAARKEEDRNLFWSA